MPRLTIDAEVLAIEPHPDQATHNPGCWAVQFRVSHAGETRTFWRWHSVRKLNENGAWIDPGNEPPTADEILKAFWDDTFNELHGFRRDVLFNNHDESIEMSKKTAKPVKKKTKPAAKTVAAKKKPKAKAPVKAKGSAKAAKKPAAKKAARKPTPKPSPSPIASMPSIVASQDAAPVPYYPDYEPKGEERDFAPLVGYFSEATDAEDLRKRMLFRAQVGNHPEDVLVAGKRKAFAMGWDIDFIDVGQPLAMGFLVPTPAPEQSEVSAVAVAPAQPEASTVEPEQPEAPTVEPEPEMTMAPEQSGATAPEQSEAPVTVSEQPSATEVAAAVIEASMSEASETSAAIDPEESPQ